MCGKTLIKRLRSAQDVLAKRALPIAMLHQTALPPKPGHTDGRPIRRHKISALLASLALLAQRVARPLVNITSDSPGAR